MIPSLKPSLLVKSSKYFFAFIPGVFFFCLAAALIIAPDTLRYFLIGGFFMFGVIFTFLAIKIVQLNSRVHHIFKSLKDQVVVQGFQIRASEHPDSSDEKIILH